MIGYREIKIKGKGSRSDPKGKRKVRDTIHVIVGIDEEYIGSSAKKMTHMRSVMSINAPKMSRHGSIVEVLSWDVYQKMGPKKQAMSKASPLYDFANRPIEMKGFKVKRILIDNGSVVEVLSWDVYQKMGPKEQALSKASLLYDFANHPIEMKGLVIIPVTLEDSEHITTEYIQFYIVDHPMAYNALFERPIMRMKKMVVTTFYMKIKFPTKIGVGFLCLDQ
ncbi:hypothetical protein PVK06_047640 [Gossypium arboreum]|uniref:Uncharacterized protein n=1 Tax=Gossypium arboreum TaxID=29729 RepID=A0ABR0MDT2_GOSAR|nr:hypothetical protein PVK06_047640 [Gossypium arboreum]